MSPAMIHTRRSSSILEVGYDGERQEIWVTFRPSGTYVYERCDADLWEALLAAESTGGFVNTVLKTDAHPFRRVSPAAHDSSAAHA